MAFMSTIKNRFGLFVGMSTAIVLTAGAMISSASTGF